MIDYYKKMTCNEIYICGGEASNTGGVYETVLNNISSGRSNGVKVTLNKFFTSDVINAVNESFNGAYTENPEGYAVIISEKMINIYSKTEIGLLFGCYALARESRNGTVRTGIIYNYPETETRAVKVFLPSEENIGFFREFVKFCSFYGCNTIVIETGGALEYKLHPEINEGWEEYCKIFEEYQGKTIDVQNAFGWKKNSIHFENGGGSWLKQEQVKELVSFCKRYFFEVIPEVPSLSHSDYFLTRHPELAERKEDPLPDTYCPSNPDTYKLLFDLLDETIEVFKPNIINIAHDEWYSIGLCDKCRGKDAAELYANDINKIYSYLKKHRVRTMMWGDKLLNAISKEGFHYGGSRIDYKTSDGREYTVPETYKSIDKIPCDIEIVNWYWRIAREYDKEYLMRNFRVIYGNFRPMQIYDYRERMTGKISGYCISNWSSPDPAHIQRNGIFAAAAYAAEMFWNHSFDENSFKDNFLRIASDIFKYHYEISQKAKYAYVVHATDDERPHKEFVDGYLMDYEKDYLGKYIISYKDGTSEEFKVYFGLNIGLRNAEIGRTEAYDSDMYQLKPYFYEPSYTCDYIEENNEIYYKTPVKLAYGKELAGIKLVEGGEKIIVKEIFDSSGRSLN